MKKKTMAILLASAVAAVGLIGLTACSDKSDGLQKGEKVTEEQWKAAIENTINAENYTITCSIDTYEKINGEYDGNSVNAEIIYTCKYTKYLDLSNYKYYGDEIETYKYSGAELLGYEDGEESHTFKDYAESEAERLYWEACCEDDEEWNVYSTSVTYVFDDNTVANFFLLNKYSATEDSEKVYLSELYSAFTYNDGIYTGTVYSEYEGEEKVSLSIKDGYIIGIALEQNSEEEEDGITYKTTIKGIILLSDFGSTTVTAPAGALEAIAAEKASNN